MGADESTPELGPAASRELLNSLHRINIAEIPPYYYRHVHRRNPPASLRQMKKISNPILVLRDSVELEKEDDRFFLSWRIASRVDGTITLQCSAIESIREVFEVEKGTNVALKAKYGLSLPEILNCTEAPCLTFEIEARPKSPPCDLCQLTCVSLERLATDFRAKVILQKIRVVGTEYVTYEIFGAEKRKVESEECVICLTHRRDTALLPCRHMCLCSLCADVFRGQASCKCPMCRTSNCQIDIEGLIEVPDPTE